jgi:hypothetical protein
MDLQKFVQLRGNLYHLTDKENLKVILETRRLSSSSALAQRAGVPDIDKFLRTRRVGHYAIANGNFKAILRDQDPLFRNIVIKNLEGGWSFEDFVFSLNSRVFFWATEKDLRTHYKRYENQGEFPKIIRVATANIFAVNKHQPEFCHLNSGAPRCSAYHTEGAPPRGPSTFLNADDYERTPSSVREVTFLEGCILPEIIHVASHPNSPYRKI